jgi:hypothetical protein
MPNDVSSLRLSLCMIVRDERANLPACFDSVQGLVDEIVVVDTGSTDGTQDYARERGAILLQSEWRGDFSAARNLALGHARGAWILVLDADETLPPRSAAEIRALVARAPAEAFNLITRNRGHDGRAVLGLILRLFPNRAEVRFQFPIHEEVNSSLAAAGIPIRDTEIEILHSGYADPATLARKAERNRAIIEQALATAHGGEAERHLRYYYADTFYQAADWARAAVEFDACAAAASEPEGKYARIVRLRAAECHFHLEDLAAAAARLPARLEAETHPVALCLAGQIAAARRDFETARQAFELLLGVRDTAFVPPAPIAKLKFKALEFLGGYWAARGRKDIGVHVLRLALALKKESCAVGAELGADYERILLAAAAA